ncbi:MAG: hypothetical protein IAE85_06905 [Anaerolinea sp.]|nr:hypothetical protein [Anaerolinea sp.]
MRPALYCRCFPGERRHDLLDVVELINAGADVRRVRQHPEQHAADRVAVFDGLVEEAMEG